MIALFARPITTVANQFDRLFHLPEFPVLQGGKLSVEFVRCAAVGGITHISTPYSPDGPVPDTFTLTTGTRVLLMSTRTRRTTKPITRIS